MVYGTMVPLGEATMPKLNDQVGKLDQETHGITGLTELRQPFEEDGCQ